jgi:predicted Zn-dependent protease
MNRREKLSELLKSSPDDPFLHYALAMEDRSAGEPAAALTRLRKVLALDPDYVSAYFQQAQVLAEQRETDAARQVLKQGVTVAQRIGDAHAAGEMTEFLHSLA